MYIIIVGVPYYGRTVERPYMYILSLIGVPYYGRTMSITVRS